METQKTLYGKGFRVIVTLALFFAVLMAVESPIGAIAESVPRYISEVVTFVGKTYDEAAKVAADNQYEILKDPLYSRTSDKGEDSFQTYLAYKTTTNPHKAVKKIKTMNMWGNWNYDKYDQYLQSVSDQTSYMMEGIEAAIDEYAKQYSAGKDSAKYTKRVLDFFYDDDTSKPISELFLLPIVENDEEAKKSGLASGAYLTREHLLEMLMQCNMQALSIIENALLYACADYNTRSFLETVSSEGFDPAAYDDRATELTVAAKDIINSLGDLQKALKGYTASGYVYTDEMLATMKTQNAVIEQRGKEAGNNADLAAITLAVRQEFVAAEQQKYEQDMANLDEAIQEYMYDNDVSEEEARKALTSGEAYRFPAKELLEMETERDTMLDAEQMTSYKNGSMLYNTLTGCTYTGRNKEYKNLYELVTAYDAEDENRKDTDPYFDLADFIPVAGAMSPGQRGMLKVGFTQVLNAEIYPISILDESLDVLVKDISKAISEVDEEGKLHGETLVTNGRLSVYANVDRTLFRSGDGIALTGAAVDMIDQDSTKTLIPNATYNTVMNALKYAAIAVGGLLVVELVTVSVVGSYWAALATGYTAYAFFGMFRVFEGGAIQAVIGGMAQGKTLFTLTGGFFNGIKAAFTLPMLKSFFVSTFVITLSLLLIAGGAMLLVYLFLPKGDANYLSIPRVMCSIEAINKAKATDPDEQEYIYYYGVKNPKIEVTEKKENNGDQGEDKKEDDKEVIPHYNQIMDICNWSLKNEDRQWLALYYTTDDRVGAPILAGSLTVDKNSNFLDDNNQKIGETMGTFSNPTFANLMSTSNLTTGKEETLYLHYKVDEGAIASFDAAFEAQYKHGSVFASWDAFAAGGIGLVLGLGGGVGLSYLARKKKKGRKYA